MKESRPLTPRGGSLPKPCRAKCGKPREDWSQSKLLNLFCSPTCAASHAKLKRDERRAKAQRKAMKEARERLKTRRDYEKEAQRAVNDYIRERDIFKPDIVYGPEYKGPIQAGHFRSVGACPALRFNTWNIHGQSMTSNQGSHKYSRYERGVSGLYEANLRERIGDARVDWLKGEHEPKQYSIEDLKRIKRIFRKRARHIKRLRETPMLLRKQA